MKEVKNHNVSAMLYLLDFPILIFTVAVSVDVLETISPSAVGWVVTLIQETSLDFFWLNRDSDISYFEQISYNSFAAYYLKIIVSVYLLTAVIIYKVLFTTWYGRPLPQFRDDPFDRKPIRMLLSGIILCVATYWLEFVQFSSPSESGRFIWVAKPLSAHNSFLFLLDGFYLFALAFFSFGTLAVLLAIMGVHLPIRSKNTAPDDQ